MAIDDEEYIKLMSEMRQLKDILRTSCTRNEHGGITINIPVLVKQLEYLKDPLIFP